MSAPAYLGDGVYATCDGFQVWLTTDPHSASAERNAIAIEPEVARELVRYALRARVLTPASLRLLADMHEQAGENGGA